MIIKEIETINNIRFKGENFEASVLNRAFVNAPPEVCVNIMPEDLENMSTNLRFYLSKLDKIIEILTHVRDNI